MTQPITWDKKSRKFLRISGIPVPVSAGSASTNLEWYANGGENFENRPRRNAVGEYKTFNYTTSPLDISKAKAIQGILNGEGSTWNFEEGFGMWSESGHWFYEVNHTGNWAVLKGQFNFPDGAGYNPQLPQAKFGNYMATIDNLIEPVTTVRVGENNEWTVMGFYCSTVSANGPHRYLWFGMNSENEKVWCGWDGASIISDPWIGTTQYIDGLQYIKIINIGNKYMDNFTALPFVVKQEEMVEIFKHASQWDMRWGFAFENGFDEPVSNCMMNSLTTSGTWDFNDAEAASCPAGGSYVFRLLNTSTTVPFKNQGDLSNTVAGGSVSDSNFFARPRSFSFWVKMGNFPIPATGVGHLLTREDNVGGLRGYRITLNRSGTTMALHCTISGLNSTTAAQEFITVNADISTAFTTPSGDDTWVHFVWTLERKYNSPTDCPTEARLYKNGLLVDTSFNAAQEGDMFWDGNPAAAVDWTFGDTGGGNGVASTYLKNFGCYGWTFSNDEAMELYRREANGATMKFPTGFTPAPDVDFYGSSVGHDQVKVAGTISAVDYLGAYKGGSFKNNLQTMTFQGSTSEVRSAPKPSTLLVPWDSAALPGNPFTTRIYPGPLQGTRPSITWICNSDYNTGETNTSPNSQFYSEGPLLLCGQNLGPHSESSGPECFDKSYYFDDGADDWRMDGGAWPTADVFNTAMGNLFLGKQAATITAWIRPNTAIINTSAGAIWRTSISTVGSSKFRLDLVVNGGVVVLRVGGRSDATDGWHFQYGTTNLATASSNGNDWIQVGGIIDLANDVFYEIVNGVRTSLGAIGAANTRFDASTARTQIGSDSTNPAKAFIYQLDLYTKGLSEEECKMVYHRDLAYFRHNMGR